MAAKTAGHQATGASRTTDTAAASASASPLSGSPPLTQHDVHYFDKLHPILLSHTLHANSDAVLALLALPEIKDSPLFWQTCTYRAGLAAALIIYIMEHTGQTAVSLSTADSSRGEGLTDGERVSTPPQHSTSLQTSPSSDSTVCVGNGGEAPQVAPLTAWELYELLQTCEPTFPRLDPPRRAPAAPSPHAAVMQAFTSACANCPLEAASTEATPDRDLSLHLIAVLRRLRRFLTGSRTATGGEADGSDTSPRVSPTQQAALTPTRQPAQALTDSDSAISLAGLVAVLQEHCSTMRYANPLRSSPAARHSSDDSRTIGSGEQDTSVSASTATTTTTRRSSSTTAAAMGISSSASRRSDSSTSRPTPVTAAVTILLPAQAGDAEVSTTEINDGDDGDNSNSSSSLDAVSVLQRIPALSETRWQAPLPAASNGGSDSATATGHGSAATKDVRRDASAPRESAGSNVAPVRGCKRRREEEAENAGLAEHLQPQPTPSQSAEEEQRVSAGIRAFDAYTAAMTEQQPTSDSSSTFVPAQRHRGGSADSRATAVQTASVTSLPSHHGESRSATAAKASATTAAAPFGGSGPSMDAPLHLPTAQPSARVIRRRTKFTPEEDVAIQRGVARFGQSPSAFQGIFHAYRAVWREGRTPSRLYDHWRDALRRRVMEAVDDPALTVAAELSEDEEARVPEENTSSVRGRQVSRWAEQEVSADIVVSSDEENAE